MIIFRKAKMSDVEKLHTLINEQAQQGLMLARSRNVLYENIREFTIAVEAAEVLGCGSLHIVWDNLAEIRALAVKDTHRGQGIGKKIIAELLQEARELEISKVFALTYQADFFQKCGFAEVHKEEMPHKVWKECINCPKFPNCDEAAFVREI